MKKSLTLLAIAALAVFCTCRGSQSNATITAPASGRTFVDLLAAQLEAVKYRSVVTRDNEVLTVRAGQAPASDVRRAICRPGGWLGNNRIVRLDETVRRLAQEGITRMRIISDSETMNVQINQQGKCEKGNAGNDGQ